MPIRYFPPLSDTRWGEIGGAIDDQADLANALAGKSNSDHEHELIVKRFRGQRLDKEYYYNQNVKGITRFASGEGWGGSGIHSSDTVNVKIGSESLRIEEEDTVGSHNVGTLNDLSLDLTRFPSGAASYDDDYIRIFFYVSNASKVSNIVFNFSPDTPYNGANRQKYIVDGNSLSNGWNYVEVQKSAFIEEGSVPWNDIRSLRLWWLPFDGSQGEYISFQYWGMVRKDPVDLKANPFQSLIDGSPQRDYSIHSGEWFIGKEEGEIIVRNIEPVAAGLWLMSDQNYDECFLYAEFDTLENDDSIKMILYGGSRNYIEVYVNAAQFVIDKTEENITTNILQENISFVPGDIARFTLERRGKTVTAKIFISGDFKILSGFEFNYSGDIYPAVAGNAIYNNINELENMLIKPKKDMPQLGNSWEPQLNWSGGTPSGNVILAGKYYRIGSLAVIRINYSADDSNGVTDLVIDLPFTPDNDAEFPVLSQLKGGGNWSDPLAYIDPAANSIKFRNFSAVADDQAIEICITAIYEV